MKTYISITEKFTLYFILIGVISTIALGTFSYNSAKNALLQRTFDQLTSIRTEKKYRIESFIKDRKREIRQLANTEVIFDLIDQAEISGVKDSNMIQAIDNIYNSYLRNYLTTNGYYEKLTLNKSDGITICVNVLQEENHVSLISETDSAFQSFLMNQDPTGIHLNDFTYDKIKDHISFNITAPVIDNNDSIRGLLSLQMSVNSINEIMFEQNPHNGLGESGESYLVGEDYLMRSTSRFKNNSVFNTKVKTQGVLEALAGNQGTEIIQDYRDITVLSSYSKVNIPDFNWVILAEIDLYEAMIPINNIRNKILFLAVLIAIIIFGFAYILSSSITKPIILLKNAAEIIGKGGESEQLKVKSRDELGQLTESFNTMAQEIQNQKKNLRISKIRSLRSMIDGQENERQRLSRELHDSLGQLLIALKLKYENTIDDTHKTKSQEEVSKMIDQTIDETRKISNNLMSAVLSEFGLVTAIKNLCQDFAKSADLNLDLSITNIPEDLSIEFKTYIYRITQEALNNIVKHSEAKNVEVCFELNKENILELKIRDDGVGFNTVNAKKCLNTNGLRNMEDRVSLLQGDIIIDSTTGAGTLLYIKIPYSSQHGKN